MKVQRGKILLMNQDSKMTEMRVLVTTMNEKYIQSTAFKINKLFSRCLAQDSNL